MDNVPRQAPLLYVDDEENDIFLLRRAFRVAEFNYPLEVLMDGALALEHLQKLKSPPCLILLDLNLPKVNGFEILSWLRHKSPWPNLPVFIFTSSDLERDQAKARELRAHEFIVKPPNPAGYAEVVRKIREHCTNPDNLLFLKH